MVSLFLSTMLCTHYFFSVAKKSREICSVCSRGFQLRREPPLHLLCSSCGKPTHTRCVRKLNRSLSSFLCQKCNPGPEHSSSTTRSENGGGEASKSGCPTSSWCMRMSRNSEFIDNIFLLIFAQVQERDIVVIPVHKESAAGNDFAGNGDFRWIKGMLEFELG